MSFQPFQKFIPKAANHYGIGSELKAAYICDQFRRMIPEIFKTKENPENYVSPAYYRNNQITINVNSSAWAQEIITRKPQIIAELNRRLGEKIIKDLRTQLFS